MKQPCDEGLVRSANGCVPCSRQAQPWVLAATILGSSMAFIDGTVVNVALPALQSSLHANVVDVQWVVESYGLFLSALILVGGALGDFIGRRLMFLLGIALFGVASAGCGLSGSIPQLIVARCFQGVGAAAMVPSSLAIISATFDEKSRGQAIGTWSGFTAITMAMGPVVGGWLIEHASWHWVFFINIPLAAAVIAISLWRVPESRSSAARRVDWLGAFFATIGLAGSVYGFLESATRGWSDPLIYGTLIAACGSLGAFVVIEERVKVPMVPLELFRLQSFAGANLLTLLLYSALGIFFFLFPMNLIQIQHYSATATGAASLPAIVLMFLLSRWSGGLVAHYGARKPLIIGPLIAAAGFLMFALPSAGGSYWTTYFPAFIVLGLGMAISVAPLTTVIMSSVKQDLVGTASGINNAVARVAGVLAVAILGVVMVTAFSQRLQYSLAAANLPADVFRQVQSSAIKLGGLDVPVNLSADAAATLRTTITAAFVFAFRLIMVICSALAAASAGVTLRMIPSTQAAQSHDAGRRALSPESLAS